MPQPQQSQQPDPDPCVPPFITPGTSGCYYVTTAVPVNFTAARSLCSDQGGRLVEIDSKEKQDEIFEYLTAGPSFQTDNFWIGATDEAVEGSWVWSTSGRPVTFTNWRAGEPSNWSANQHCGRLVRLNHANAGKWEDVECNQLIMTLCEIGEHS